MLRHKIIKAKNKDLLCDLLWNLWLMSIDFVTNCCLPLREVVSWNDYELRRIQRGRTSTSAWGSELKWLTWYLLACVSPPSTSAWGSELKYVFENKTDSTWRLPLREVVSWNTGINEKNIKAFSLPLREVVSWNKNLANAIFGNIVYLCVR